MPMQFYHVIVKPISKQFQQLKEEKDEKESFGIDVECCYGFLAGSLRRR